MIDNVTPQAQIVYLVYRAATSGGHNFLDPLLTTAAGVFYARDLPPQQADLAGEVTWLWTVSANTPAGATTVTVTCTPGGTVTRPISPVAG